MGRRCASGMFSPGLFGSRLIVVAENHQAGALVADIADIEHQVLAEFPLDGEVPALHIAGAVIGRRVVGAGSAVEKLDGFVSRRDSLAESARKQPRYWSPVQHGCDG